MRECCRARGIADCFGHGNSVRARARRLVVGIEILARILHPESVVTLPAPPQLHFTAQIIGTTLASHTSTS